MYQKKDDIYSLCRSITTGDNWFPCDGWFVNGVEWCRILVFLVDLVFVTAMVQFDKLRKITGTSVIL